MARPQGGATIFECVDSTTFAVVDDAGALWVARGQPFDIVQRFDVSGP